MLSPISITVDVTVFDSFITVDDEQTIKARCNTIYTNADTECIGLVCQGDLFFDMLYIIDCAKKLVAQTRVKARSVMAIYRSNDYFLVEYDDRSRVYYKFIFGVIVYIATLQPGDMIPDGFGQVINRQWINMTKIDYRVGILTKENV